MIPGADACRNKAEHRRRLLVVGRLLVPVSETPPVQVKTDERRRHQRMRLNLLGRFMLANKREYPCQVMNMSPGGASFITPVGAEIGDRVVAYIDHIGRVEGTVSRIFEGGFAIQLSATVRKREKLAAQLTWLANRKTLGMPEDRRHERIVPNKPEIELKLIDGRSYPCQLIDMSISGAAIAIAVRPALGSRVTLGKMNATVVRHFELGIAIEFDDVQERRSLVAKFGEDSVDEKNDVPLSA